MKARLYSLSIFDEGAAQGAASASTGAEGAAQGTAPAASQTSAQTVQPSGGYSYAQAEEIATARAQKAEKAALASYFRQQGMSEDEVTKAITAYKAAQKAKEPDINAITRERDEAQAKLATYERKETLMKKGVKSEFAEFVAFQAGALMKSDSNLDTFEKAADKFLKDNPQYAGSVKPTYRAARPAQGAGSSGGAEKSKEEARAALNAAIKQAARRR